MTNKDAIDTIERLYPIVSEETKQAYDKALKQLWKEEPKKPISNNKYFKCPTCQYEVGYTDGNNRSIMRYCCECGQHILWS